MHRLRYENHLTDGTQLCIVKLKENICFFYIIGTVYIIGITVFRYIRHKQRI